MPRHCARPEAAGYAIAPAGDATVAGVLMLLPELLECETLPPRLWVAHLPDQPAALIGAAAMLPVLHDARAPGFRVMARVLPDHRRRGIGTALLQAVRTEAQAWGVLRLHGWYAHDAGGEAAFLRSIGFGPLESVSHFIGDTERSLSLCDERVQSWRVRGRMPSDASVVALETVNHGAAAGLYCLHFGGSVQATRQRWARELEDDATRQLSVAVVRHGELAGFLLMKCRDAMPEADLWISRPDQRHGWVSLLSLHGALQRCAALGAKRHRFHCNESARATLNFARRCGAILVALHHTYRLELAA